jgi:hypothetical protein
MQEIITAYNDTPAVPVGGGTGYPHRVWTQHEGGVVDPLEPFVLISSDGTTHIVSGVKARADAERQPEEHHAECAADVFNNEAKCPSSKVQYPYVPHKYMDQVQGGMHVQGLSRTKLVVYTPATTRIWEIPYDRAYCVQLLWPSLRDAYFSLILPRVILRDQGVLPQGSLFLDENPHRDVALPVKELAATVHPNELDLDGTLAKEEHAWSDELLRAICAGVAEQA